MDNNSPLDKLNINSKASCSKSDLTASEFDTKLDIVNKNVKTKQLFEVNDTETRLYESASVLNNYSNYEIYDVNNNCMLTNLNEFGFRYFDINSENENNNRSSNNYLNDNISNDIKDFFNTSTDERSFEDINYKEANCDGRNYKVDEKICNRETNNYNLIQDNTIELNNDIKVNVKDETKDMKQKQYIDLVFSDPLHENDIEKVLKCSLIVKENFQTNKKDFKQIKNESEEIDNVDNKHCLVDKNSNIETVETEDPILHPNSQETDDSDVCSYHSSDFEFIDEIEANKGLMINFNPSARIFKNINKVETKDISKEFESEYIIYDYFNIPGPSAPKNDSIPTGNDYDNMFLWPCVPLPCRNMENKAVHSIRGMNVSDGAGFDMNVLLPQRDLDNKYKQEADESAKIIVSMYPYENRERCTQRRT